MCDVIIHIHTSLLEKQLSLNIVEFIWANGVKGAAVAPFTDTDLL